MSIQAEYTGVLLAAGVGRRAGGNKLLWKLGRGRVIDFSIHAQRSVCRTVKVVVGAHIDELKDYIQSNYSNVEIIHNPNWEEGEMFSSVKCGLVGVQTAAFIHPADIPGASLGVYNRLRSEFESDPADFLKPTFNRIGGHPLLIGTNVIGAIAKADPNTHLREVLTEWDGRRVNVDDELILKDLDTRADYEELSKVFAGRIPENEEMDAPL